MKQEITLNAGESKGVSFLIRPSMAGKYSVKLNGLSGSLVVKTVARFVMLGGIVREALWPTEDDHFIMDGELMNVGDIEGTIQPHGWWKVGNSDIVYDKPFDPVILGPGESVPLSFTISREEMIQAQQEAGWGYNGYQYLFVVLSTSGYALYGREWGWQYTRCVVYIER